MSEESITCPVCKMTSYHPDDVRYRYCGKCHQFHECMQMQVLEEDWPEEKNLFKRGIAVVSALLLVAWIGASFLIALAMTVRAE